MRLRQTRQVAEDDEHGIEEDINPLELTVGVSGIQDAENA